MRKNQRWASAAYAAYPYLSGSTRLNGSQGVGGSGVSSTSSSLFRDKEASARTSKNAQALGLMGGFAELKLRLRELDGASRPPPTSLPSSSCCRASTRELTRASFSCHADASELDAVALLHPFLEVVRSPETSGPITATALSSIDKFVTYSILSPSSPNLALAMSQLSSAGTHCKFEASDSVSDEVVLLKILDVLRNCLTGHLGDVLSDESVCEMMETGLSMCCQMRLSGASSSRLLARSPSSPARTTT